ncbi:hypothetical protein Nos7524_3190 [Nostoc sp. PCC 7524]|uniref:hypothetical protein n=1 Tax=Nostoc sp. (strain ATCC 29411 / PCC 7524) TaxID=28072 RepID=UPI00029F04EA|nr:hypothetical protein [Nostoc sp. PCC 7524]AFY48990.1 hypothetical protein Nos7524_3190 [Nostoc sp. PCC 7524]
MTSRLIYISTINQTEANLIAEMLGDSCNVYLKIGACMGDDWEIFKEELEEGNNNLVALDMDLSPEVMDISGCNYDELVYINLVDEIELNQIPLPQSYAYINKQKMIEDIKLYSCHVDFTDFRIGQEYPYKELLIQALFKWILKEGLSSRSTILPKIGAYYDYIQGEMKVA